MASLKGRVAVVAGASRGVGKGVALGLGEAGATVYVTARTTEERQFDIPGTITQTAEEVTNLGGKGIPVRCDYRNNEEVEAVFDRVLREQGRLDILVNSVWGGYENLFDNGEYTWEAPFWEQPAWRWDAMFDSGVKAYFLASRRAASIMSRQRSGLIVNISDWAAKRYISNVINGVAKAAIERLTADMAHELRVCHVAVVSLYPGRVRTERMMKASTFFRLSNTESPQFTGRAVAALAQDPNILKKTGQSFVVAQLAREYGFADIDSTMPKPLTHEDF